MEILSVTPITEAEYPAKPRAGGVKAIRDSHHRIAAYYAMGLAPAKIAEITGRSIVSIRNFAHSPANQELIAQKREVIEEREADALAEQVKIITRARSLAWEQIVDQLEEAAETGEKLPLSRLLAVAGDSADRTGLGRQSMQVNLNVGIAAQLEARMARANALMDRRSAKVIDITPRIVEKGLRRI